MFCCTCVPDSVIFLFLGLSVITAKMILFLKLSFWFCRQTKPLTFADCIGDELPVGWEEAYDPVVGAYYVDHNTSELPSDTLTAQLFI